MDKLNNNQTKSIALVNGTHLCLLQYPKIQLKPFDNHINKGVTLRSSNPDRTEKNDPSPAVLVSVPVPALCIQSIPTILWQRNVRSEISVNNNRKNPNNIKRTAGNGGAMNTNANMKHCENFDSFVVNDDSIWKELFIDEKTIEQYFIKGSVTTTQRDIIQCPEGIEITRNIEISHHETDTKSLPSLTVIHSNGKGGIFLRTQSTKSQKRGSKSAHYDYSLLDEKGKEIFHLKNEKSGFFIADFFGMNAFEQVMFLPPMSQEYATSRIDNKKLDNLRSYHINSSSDIKRMAYIIKQKRTLINILAHSLMTNGSDINFHRLEQDANVCVKLKEDRKSIVPLITLPIKPENFKAAFSSSNSLMDCKSKENQSKKRKRCETDGSLSTPISRSYSALVFKSLTNQTDQFEKDTAIDRWKDKIKYGLQQRLKYELKKKRKEANICLIKQQVLQQNKLMLQKLSLGSQSKFNKTQPKYNSIQGSSFLEIVRIRHLAQVDHTNLSLYHPNSLTIKLNLETDILLWNKEIISSALFSTQHKNRLNDDHLLDLQLACSQKNSHLHQNNIVLKTQSGIVPYLRAGQCVTIVATVFLSGIKLINGLKTSICFTLNAHWLTKPSKGTNCKMNMSGTKLGTLVIPVESLLFGQKYESINTKQDIGCTSPTSNCNNHILLYEDTSLHHVTTLATYEYRKPRMLVIDVSHDVGVDLVKEFKTTIEKMNRKINCESHVYVNYDKERMLIDVTMIAGSPEYRAMVTEHILKYLPNNAKIIKNSTESIKDSCIIQSTLTAIDEEIKLLETHAKKKKLSSAELNEIVRAQSQTDEFSSKLIKLLIHQRIKTGALQKNDFNE